MTSHPDHLAELSAAGVAVWLDDISRERLTSGNLAALVRDRHVVGVTSNPTIFDHALSHGSAYNEQLGELALRGVSVGEASRDITAYDVRWACDVLRPVHDATGGMDGRVSLEVDPRLANDTANAALAIDKGSLAITSNPSNGSVKVNADDTVTYTPASGLPSLE